MATHSSTLAWKIPRWRSLVGCSPWGWTRLSNFTFTFHFHALEKEMATHSSVLAWRIPGTGEGWAAWWAAVYGVPQSQTRLKRLSSSSSSRTIEASLLFSQSSSHHSSVWIAETLGALKPTPFSYSPSCSPLSCQHSCLFLRISDNSDTYPPDLALPDAPTPSFMSLVILFFSGGRGLSCAMEAHLTQLLLHSGRPYNTVIIITAPMHASVFSKQHHRFFAKFLSRILMTNKYTQLDLKWITNKDLLYSTGNSAQCYVAAWMGGE